QARCHVPADAGHHGGHRRLCLDRARAEYPALPQQHRSGDPPTGSPLRAGLPAGLKLPASTRRTWRPAAAAPPGRPTPSPITRIHEVTRQIRHHETVWIPMSDGARLAARLWLPEDAERDPVPAILEYIPYRRRDGTRAGDERTHPWLAAQGYACV